MSDTLPQHAAYPFFATAREMFDGLDEEALKPSPIRERAVTRVTTAVTGDPTKDETLGRNDESNADEAMSYPLARILVSIIDEDDVTTAYAEAEAEAAVERLKKDTSMFSNVEYDLSVVEACAEIGLDGVVAVEWRDLFYESTIFEGWADLSTDERIRRMENVLEFTTSDKFGVSSAKVSGTLEDVLDGPLGGEIRRDPPEPYYAVPPSDYLQHAPLHNEKWALARRSFYNGGVLLRKSELFDLLENAIHAEISSNLPADVPPKLIEEFEEEVGTLLTKLPDDLTDSIDVRKFHLLDDAVLPREYALGWEDRETYEPLGEEEVEIPLEQIRDHYAEAKPVYEELGTINGLHTGWLPSHNGWYVYEMLTDRSDHEEAWDAGFTQVQRPSLLPDDFDASEAGRSVYTTNSYSPKDVYRKRPFKYEDGDSVWMDEVEEDMEQIEPLPGYGELGAYSLLVDIDLEDEWKQRPLPEKYRDVVETRLRAWVNFFASFMGGDPDDVFVVDSGGGAYVMTPPAVTKQIAEEFDEAVEIDVDEDGDTEDEDDEVETMNEVEQINMEIRDRMRTLTSVVDEVITGLDNAPDELFSADSVQNKNRQWKTLLSVHSSLDVIVHPIDPTVGSESGSDADTRLDGLSYTPIQFDEVSSEDYEEAEAWAAEFTSLEYDADEYLDSLVSVLFTSEVFDQIDSYHTVFETDEGDGWREILETFLEHRKQRVGERVDPYRPGDSDGSIGDVGVTTSRREVIAAIHDADLKSYVRQNHAQRWDTDNRSDGTVSFSPRTWRKPSPDANSCFYGPGDGAGAKPIIFDRKESFSADIVDLVAYDNQIISHPSQKPEGEDWWRAVEYLREEVGEDIPINLPDITDDSNNYDRLSSEHIAQAALALNIATEDDVETRDGEYGEYRDLTDSALYNETLDALEDEDIEHGRERRS